MVSITTDQLQQVLASVADWPAHDRILLARKILETVEPVTLPDAQRSPGETARYKNLAILKRRELRAQMQLKERLESPISRPSAAIRARLRR